MAELKGSALVIMTSEQVRQVTKQELVPALDGTFGRLRAVTRGPDGALYISTSNGSDDKVLRLRPTGAGA